jgi:hypothetical protein
MTTTHKTRGSIWQGPAALTTGSGSSTGRPVAARAGRGGVMFTSDITAAASPKPSLVSAMQETTTSDLSALIRLATIDTRVSAAALADMAGDEIARRVARAREDIRGGK